MEGSRGIQGRRIYKELITYCVYMMYEAIKTSEIFLIRKIIAMFVVNELMNVPNTNTLKEIYL